MLSTYVWYGFVWLAQKLRTQRRTSTVRMGCLCCRSCSPHLPAGRFDVAHYARPDPSAILPILL